MSVSVVIEKTEMSYIDLNVPIVSCCQ